MANMTNLVGTMKDWRDIVDSCLTTVILVVKVKNSEVELFREILSKSNQLVDVKEYWGLFYRTFWVQGKDNIVYPIYNYVLYNSIGPVTISTIEKDTDIKLAWLRKAKPVEKITIQFDKDNNRELLLSSNLLDSPVKKRSIQLSDYCENATYEQKLAEWIENARRILSVLEKVNPLLTYPVEPQTHTPYVVNKTFTLKTSITSPSSAIVLDTIAEQNGITDYSFDTNSLEEKKAIMDQAAGVDSTGSVTPTPKKSRTKKAAVKKD